MPRDQGRFANLPGPATGNIDPHLLALLHLPGLGPRSIHKLLAHFGQAQAVFAAPREDLARSLGGKSRAIAAILAGPDEKSLQTDLDWLAQPGHYAVTWASPLYPPLLAELPDRPPLLFVQGDPRMLCHPQLAVVGSRNPSPGGRENARAFAAHLAGMGLTITSGLALGIDGAAHEGALASDGGTIAVTGTGLDRIYPSAHRELATRIARQGALVSEFPPGTPPRRDHFPRRNRLISGLCMGTLVVEAAARSGSLITARLAVDQGREVFAIPGSIHSPLSRGCHALIRDGAKLVETAHDILEELGPLLQLTTRDRARPAPTVTEGPARYREMLAFIGHDPISLDQLIQRSGLTAAAVSSILLEMELRGLVAQNASGTYVRVP
jgi:DNA processing protein